MRKQMLTVSFYAATESGYIFKGWQKIRDYKEVYSLLSNWLRSGNGAKVCGQWLNTYSSRTKLLKIVDLVKSIQTLRGGSL